jgi:hypothetical protein
MLAVAAKKNAPAPATQSSNTKDTPVAVKAGTVNTSVEVQNNGQWAPGKSQLVTLTVNSALQHSLNLKSVVITGAVSSPSNTITACENKWAAGSPGACADGTADSCSVMTCVVDVPINFPQSDSYFLTASWQDCMVIQTDLERASHWAF